MQQQARRVWVRGKSILVARFRFRGRGRQDGKRAHWLFNRPVIIEHPVLIDCRVKCIGADTKNVLAGAGKQVLRNNEAHGLSLLGD